MGFLDRLRAMLAGPTHIQGGDDEGAAALHEEYGVPDEGAAEIEEMAETGLGGFGSVSAQPSPAVAEGAESAEEDLESEEAPPDPNP